MEGRGLIGEKSQYMQTRSTKANTLGLSIYTQLKNKRQ
jgi:hypothetical protein